MSFKILTLNNIARERACERLPRERYEVASDIAHPDGSALAFARHARDGDPGERARRRACGRRRQQHTDTTRSVGAACRSSIRPGANANAVKELVLGGLFLAARNI
jgi:D-3-phosphoglycerate dehydrogenase / 2-oxoglutarate reductase